MNQSAIAVDASVAIKWVIPAEEHAAGAQSL